MIEGVDRSAPGAEELAGLLARPRFELVPLSNADPEAGHLPRGATVTVTSSPRRGIDATVDLAARLAGRGFRAVPHVAAKHIRGPGHLEDLAGRLEAAGIGDVFAIGGDGQEAAGPYPDALSLLEGLAGGGHRLRAGVAGYPERHPFIDDEQLARALLRKQPLASYVVTQICFDPAAIFSWLDRARGQGIHLPVHIGLPGAVTRRRLLEIALRIGVGDSIRYLTKHGGLVARLVRRGGYRPDQLLAGMAPYLGRRRHAVAGFHLNTFNQVRSTERWRRRTLSGLGVGTLPEDEAGA